MKRSHAEGNLVVIGSGIGIALFAVGYSLTRQGRLSGLQTEATAVAADTAWPTPKWKDGVYVGRGTSRHGDIEASVEIREGHIVSAKITQCLTRYSCSWIDDLPSQVTARQSAEVDFVSGATHSSDAFRGAIADALTKAH